jgi:acyl carrier protein
MKQKLIEILADVLDLEADQIDDDLSAETAKSWDSLNHLRLITAVEQDFGIALTMEEIEGATSLMRLLSVIEARTRKA